MPPTSGPENGFTLIELLVVLTIAAMLSVTAAALRPAGRVDLDRVADELARDLRQARQRALSSGRDTVVQLASSSVAMPGIDARALPDGVTLILEPGSDVKRLPAEMIFRAGGGATGATLSLRHDDRRETVAVGWLTGAVRHE